MSSILALWMISWCLPSPRLFTSHLPSEVSTGSPLMQNSTGAPDDITTVIVSGEKLIQFELDV